MSRSAPSTRSILRDADVRRVLLSDAISGSGDVTYWIALIVYLLGQRDDGALISLAVMARLLPRVIFGAFGGAIADRFDRRRLLMVLDASRAALMFVLAAVVAGGRSPIIVLLLVFATCTLSTPYRPAVSAGYPHIVPENRLAAANALSNTIGQLIGLTGPLLAAALLSVTSPAVAISANGATYLVSVVALSGVRGLGRASSSAEHGGPDRSRLRRGLTQIRENPSVGALIGTMAAVMLLRGVELVLHVRVAIDQLGLGDAGYGWISAALGLGALIAATGVSRIAETRRPGLIMIVSGAVGCVTLASLSIVHQPAIGLAFLVVEGISTVVFEVLALTMMQRVCHAGLLGTVLGLQSSASGFAKLAGSLLAPLAAFAFGLPTAMATLALLVAACLALFAPAVARIGAVAAERRLELDPIVDALQSVTVLDGMERPARERLAMTAAATTVTAGSDVVRLGDPADDFYVICSGSFDVTIGDDLVAQLGPGDSFGEIGLLNRSARTATVSATTDGELWRIPGDSFIEAATAASVSPNTAIDSLSPHTHEATHRRGSDVEQPVR